MCNIRWPTQNDTRGNTIVLCLPFIVVMIALVHLTFLQNISFTSTMNHFRIRGARDSLVNNIKGYSSMPSTFRSSLQAGNFASNPDLQNCVFGTGASPCQPGVELPVTLYSPVSSSMIISGPAALNGNQTQAALYDAKGNLCANATGAATTQCPFEVTTSFVATCPPGQTSCTTAQSLEIHYYIKRKNDSGIGASVVLRDTISDVASAVDVSKILPSSGSSTQGNVMVSKLTASVGDGTTYPVEILSAIEKGVLIARDSKIPADQEAAIAKAFLDNGYTDPTFIQTVTRDTYWEPDWRNTILVIEGLAALGITDLQQADTLAKIGIADPKYMQKILDSGVTDPYLVNNLYWTLVDKDAATMAGVVNALNNLPHDNDLRVLAIGQLLITDRAVAEQMFNSVSSISDTWIGYGLIKGGWTSDTTKINAIVTATAGLPSIVGAAIAQEGVTDSSLAQQLNAAVSVLDNIGLARELILAGGGNLADTQQRVAEYLASVAANPTPTPTPAVASATPTPTPVEMTSLSICTTCKALTF